MKKAQSLFMSAVLILALAAGCGKREGPESPPAIPGTPAAKAAFDPAKGTASLTGKVVFEGTAPAPAAIKMNADAVCVSMHKDPVYSEELLVDNGNLQNVFVYIKEGLEKYSFAAPGEPVVLAQEGCRYVPHVGGVMVHQKFKLINNDPTVHNVRCMAEKNPSFNLGQPTKGMEIEKSFAVPEIMLRIKCDVHKWMSAYVGVLPHPYFAVTGRDGTFALRNLPPGEYTIEAWHEKLGMQTQKVALADKESKELRLSFRAT